MVRRAERSHAADDDQAGEATDSASAGPASKGPAADDPALAAGNPLALDGLGVVGITRRRVAFLLGAIVATWIVIVFARQVGEAATASAQAAELRSQNADLGANVAALRRELDTIQEEPFVLQQARANGLGSPDERPFRLAPGAPPLPPDAPGSAVSRLGSVEHRQTPLESWLSLLFGPSPDA